MLISTPVCLDWSSGDTLLTAGAMTDRDLPSLEKLQVQAERFINLLHTIAPHLKEICVLHESNFARRSEYQCDVFWPIGQRFRVVFSLDKIGNLDVMA